MIKIDNKFYVDADINSFQLKEDTGKVDKRTGTKIGYIHGYYPTVEGALNGYIKFKLREYISSKTQQSLNDLKDEIHRLEDLISSLTENR